jgi:two-component system, sensor histidine kinase and response regulator
MSHASSSAEGSTVLLVDDDDETRGVVKYTLEAKGYRVREASSGAEALAAFEQASFDCVLLDVRMAQMDGFTACARIRSLPRGGDTTIVFLTALGDLDTFDRALGAGGDDFVTKPTAPDELQVRIETALKLRQLRVEHQKHHELLKQQHDGLMRLQLEKERLMAFIVHDLRNPVNSMSLHAQVVLREPGLPPAVRESVAQIRMETRQLSRMISNLLDVSKAAEGRLKTTPTDVDLRALVDEVVAELEINTRSHGVTIRTSLGVARIHGDEDLVRRMIANLVENATRHAPRGTEVTVTTAPSEEGTELRVADRGVGVPREMRERVFDAFVQVKGEGRPDTAGGRGLGLTFCKLAAHAHGGRIWVDDAAPGAAFCVLFPSRSSAPNDVADSTST